MNRQILIVEDNPEDREAYRRLFQQIGGEQFDIYESDSGEQGILYCQSNSPDCVLLDYQLPDLNGIEFITALHGSDGRPEIPVVMLTGKGSESVAVEAMKLGAHDYLIKGDITAEALYRSVSNAIDKATMHRRLAQKQRELEQFAYVASHDLKAPLSKVQMAVKMLEQVCGDKLDEKAAEVLNVIGRSVEGMIQLVSDLLEFARAGGREVSWETVNLRILLSQVLANLEVPLRECDAEVETGELPTIFGLKTGLNQILQNLIANALKFRSGDRPCIRISSAREASQWHFTIADNGIGIPPESHQDVFTPLKRLHGKSAYEGVGLGLATCKKVVEHHGGKIWVESQLGKGSTFHFTIPDATGRPEC